MSGAVVSEIERLGATGDEQALPTLVDWLIDGRPEIREAAAWALGALGSSGAAGALLYAACNDSAWPVRQQAAQSLVALGGGWLEQITAAPGGEHEVHRLLARAPMVVLALGRSVPPAMVCSGLRHPEPTVRASAAWIVGELVLVDARDAIAAALLDEAPTVRHMAAWALSELP